MASLLLVQEEDSCHNKTIHQKEAYLKGEIRFNNGMPKWLAWYGASPFLGWG